MLDDHKNTYTVSSIAMRTKSHTPFMVLSVLSPFFDVQIIPIDSIIIYYNNL